MPARRILYVPWNIKQARSFVGARFNGTPGYEFVEKNNEWIRACEAKEVADDLRKDIYQVWYHLDDLRTVIKSSLLAGLGQDDQVYIRGHCTPGRTYLSTEKPFSKEAAARRYGAALIQDQQFLQAAEVAARLQASGLHPSFRGKIKCYNCNSAAPTNGENFALTFALEMRLSGFTHCQVFGYVGTLDSFHDADNYSSVKAEEDEKGKKTPKHKFAYNEGEDPARASTKRYVVEVGPNQELRLQKA